MKRILRYSLGGVGAIALIAAVMLARRAPAPPVPNRDVPAAATSDAPESAEPAATDITHQVRSRAVPTRPSAGQPEATGPDETTSPRWPGSELSAEELAMSKEDMFLATLKQVREWTFEDYLRRLARRERLSGREAYQVFMYLRSCMEMPRSFEELQAETDRVESTPSAAGEAEATIGRLRSGLLQCENLPSNTNLALITLDWLTVAAERGYAPAQMAYRRNARRLLERDPWNAYRHPDRVQDYRRLARSFLDAAVRSGHPDAFIEYAYALQEGLVFDTDPQLAYAYVAAADQAQRGGHEEAQYLMTWLERELSPPQIREASRAGRELCRQWCRGQDL